MITSYPGSPDKVGGTDAATQVDVELESDDDWLIGKPTKDGKPYRPQWAVRMEIWRDICSPQPFPRTYILKTWLRQCKTDDCRDVIGYFFEDTRVFYAPTTPIARPAQLEQPISLLSGDHQDFERFLFGFTSQTATGDLQTATIRNFQLSFIRPDDPFITDDPDWP